MLNVLGTSILRLILPAALFLIAPQIGYAADYDSPSFRKARETICEPLESPNSECSGILGCNSVLGDPLLSGRADIDARALLRTLNDIENTGLANHNEHGLDLTRLLGGNDALREIVRILLIEAIFEDDLIAWCRRPQDFSDISEAINKGYSR